MTIPEFDYASIERDAKALPERWVAMRPDVVLDEGDVGGDVQDGEAWGRRFVRWLPVLGRWEVLTDCFYAAVEEDDETGAEYRWVERQIERVLCRDIRDVGGTEEQSDYRYEKFPDESTTEEARGRAACLTTSAYYSLPVTSWADWPGPL